MEESISIVKKNFINYINMVVKNNKVSHAYLVEIDDYEKDCIYIFNFIKMILFNISYYEIESCDNSDIFLIDTNNYPDIKIIESEGSNIKKSQLIELQKDYSNKSLLNGKRIYIIKEAEKLNVSSANTMLKFLEEPEDNIIAFLVTDNRYRVIETILSRCQILNLKENDLKISNEDSILNLLECVVNPQNFFVKYRYFIENVLVDRKTTVEKFSLIENIVIYYLNSIYFEEENINSDLIAILKKVDNNKLLNCISIIEENMSKLEFNVNYKLWIDSLFSQLIIGG